MAAPIAMTEENESPNPPACMSRVATAWPHFTNWSKLGVGVWQKTPVHGV